MKWNSNIYFFHLLPIQTIDIIDCTTKYDYVFGTINENWWQKFMQPCMTTSIDNMCYLDTVESIQIVSHNQVRLVANENKQRRYSLVWICLDLNLRHGKGHINIYWKFLVNFWGEILLVSTHATLAVHEHNLLSSHSVY